MQKLGVVLVNYNGIKYNKACIDSIRESDWKGDIQIYCVDNASKDGSPDWLRKHYGEHEWFHLIEMGKNSGFSAANNTGLHMAVNAGCDYLMILNNDTCIERDMVRKLVERAEGKSCIVAPKICYWDRKDIIWSAGGFLSPIIWKPGSFGEGKRDAGDYDQEKECTCLNGCCMLFSAQTFLLAGDMNEDFFLYYEDTEYCLMAMARGIHLLYCPEAKMYHKVSASTGGRTSPDCAYYISRNWPMCMKKRMKKIRFALFIIYFLINRAACFCVWGMQGRKDLVKAGFRGIRDFQKKRVGKYIK